MTVTPPVTPLLAVEELSVRFRLPQGELHAVTGLSFTLAAGETLALVGESGCGKSVTASALLRLVQPPGEIAAGRVLFHGQDLLRLPDDALRQVRGNRIGMVFQEPMTSLNPVFRVGDQVAEGLQLHRGYDRAEAWHRAEELLEEVGIPAAATRLRDYPHQLSGGMRQRVMLAMALACGPELLVADEPTTALDVTIQAQLLALLDRLKAQRRMGLLLITHDFGVVAERADRVLVMYAGSMVESAPCRELLATPRHPYTQGLLASLPERADASGHLQTIPGTVPSLFAPAVGCAFCARCPHADQRCRTAPPPVRDVAPGHQVRCWQVVP